ncbi:hypothetical protein BC628DRAFT_158807 [Trametes gibbosa]|nr:hypothetical protein BC628DRAFT_158807 [Trametes gibbosa]
MNGEAIVSSVRIRQPRKPAASDAPLRLTPSPSLSEGPPETGRVLGSRMLRTHGSRPFVKPLMLSWTGRGRLPQRQHKASTRGKSTSSSGVSAIIGGSASLPQGHPGASQSPIFRIRARRQLRALSEVDGAQSVIYVGALDNVAARVTSVLLRFRRSPRGLTSRV